MQSYASQRKNQIKKYKTYLVLIEEFQFFHPRRYLFVFIRKLMLNSKLERRGDDTTSDVNIIDFI
jgi:hypothetical protein